MKKKKNNFYLASLFSIIIATVAFAGCARDKQMQTDVSFNIKFLDESDNQPTKDLLNLNDELAAPDAKPLIGEPAFPDPSTWFVGSLDPNAESSPQVLKKRPTLYRQYGHADFLREFLDDFSYVIQVFRAKDRDKLQFEKDGIFATSEAILTLDPLKLLNQPYKLYKDYNKPDDPDNPNFSEAERKIFDACTCAIEHDVATPPIPADQSVALALPAGGEFFMRVYVYHPAHMYRQKVVDLNQLVGVHKKLTPAESGGVGLQAELDRRNDESVTFKPVYFANTANFTVDLNTKTLNLDLALKKEQTLQNIYLQDSNDRKNYYEYPQDLVKLIDARSVGLSYLDIELPLFDLGNKKNVLSLYDYINFSIYWIADGNKYTLRFDRQHTWPPKVYSRDEMAWRQAFIRIDNQGKQIPFHDNKLQHTCVFDTGNGAIYAKKPNPDKPKCLSLNNNAPTPSLTRRTTSLEGYDDQIFQNRRFLGFMQGLGHSEFDVTSAIDKYAASGAIIINEKDASADAQSLMNHLYITYDATAFNRNLNKEQTKRKVSIHNLFFGGKEADITDYDSEKRVYRERICIKEYYRKAMPPDVSEQCFYTQADYEASKELQQAQQQP